MTRFVIIQLIAYLVCISTAVADDYGEIGPCEGALELLVTKLEAQGEFSDENRIDALPDADSEYSPCFISVDDVSDRDAITYFIYRHSDDVTVFVYRARVIASTFVWYGPFYSAYRK